MHKMRTWRFEVDHDQCAKEVQHCIVCVSNSALCRRSPAIASGTSSAVSLQLDHSHNLCNAIATVLLGVRLKQLQDCCSTHAKTEAAHTRTIVTQELPKHSTAKAELALNSKKTALCSHTPQQIAP